MSKRQARTGGNLDQSARYSTRTDTYDGVEDPMATAALEN
jgi:hypothetical protein